MQAKRRSPVDISVTGFGAIFAQTVVLKLQGKLQAGTDILANLLQQAPRPDGKTLIEQLEIYTRKNSPPALARRPGGTQNGGAP